MRCKFLIFTLLILTGMVGCRNPVKVCTWNRLCGPIEISTSPVKIETAPLEVSARVVSRDMTPLSDRQVRQASVVGAGRVAIVDIDGLLINENRNGPLSIGDNPVSLFREKLDAIERDSTVRAVVLRIHSPGGGVTASDIMRRDLAHFRSRTGLPVVACLMDVATGGAYYVGSAADTVIAHPTTITGGIGVILNLYNLEDALSQLNIVGVPVKAGGLVDIGSPLRVLPAESRQILQQIANDFHQRFREIVMSSRVGLEEAEEIFDGRVLTASQALEYGLVDTLGYLDDAIDQAQQMGNCVGGGVVVLRRDQDTAHTPYDVAGSVAATPALFPSIPGLDRSRLPTFLYIWQPDPSLSSEMGG